MGLPAARRVRPEPRTSLLTESRRKVRNRKERFCHVLVVRLAHHGKPQPFPNGAPWHLEADQTGTRDPSHVLQTMLPAVTVIQAPLTSSPHSPPSSHAGPWYEVECALTEGRGARGRGIYLREPHEAAKPQTVRVTVTPKLKEVCGIGLGVRRCGDIEARALIGATP